MVYKGYALELYVRGIPFKKFATAEERAWHVWLQWHTFLVANGQAMGGAYCQPDCL